ncbi:hypothetical protein BJY17_002456 [Agromyces hippuratus]|uniref:Uncharacterized protein n=1 Tax=Agromyces hippuratus TaxID=286438 RepID=A0A852WUU9_9MICO|nr:hypothetical protein [Agromyces hippuratus]
MLRARHEYSPATHRGAALTHRALTIIAPSRSRVPVWGPSLGHWPKVAAQRDLRASLRRARMRRKRADRGEAGRPRGSGRMFLNDSGLAGDPRAHRYESRASRRGVRELDGSGESRCGDLFCDSGFGPRPRRLGRPRSPIRLQTIGTRSRLKDPGMASRSISATGIGLRSRAAEPRFWSRSTGPARRNSIRGLMPGRRRSGLGLRRAVSRSNCGASGRWIGIRVPSHSVPSQLIRI